MKAFFERKLEGLKALFQPESLLPLEKQFQELKDEGLETI